MLILMVGFVHAARITVGPADEDFPLIQKAIDNSTDGDIIEVHSGTYIERLRIRKPLTLLGLDTGEGLPVVNASGSSSAVILTADGSTVEGFNLTRSGHCACGSAGMQVASNNNTVQNNILYKSQVAAAHPAASCGACFAPPPRQSNSSKFICTYPSFSS